MKAKKLMAILVSVCMLLVLVPVFTLMASADDVTVPAKKDGATNYAADYELLADSNGGLPVDNGDGSFTMGDSHYANRKKVSFALDGLNATDDYVIQFTAGALQNWTSTDWSPLVALTSNIDTLNFGMGGSGANVWRSAGTATNYAGPYNSTTHTFTIYAKYNAEETNRDYYVFIDGTLTFTMADQTASDPHLILASANDRNTAYTYSNVSVYNPNELVIQGENDWARDEDTLVTVTNGEATAVYDYATGSITWKHKGTGKLTLNPAGLGDEFVVSFSMKWSTGSWGGGGYKFQLAGQDIVTVRKDNADNTLATDLALGNGPTNFWFHVYPNANDSSKSDVDVVIGTFKKTVTGLSLGKNPTVAMQQMAQVWGDTTTFTNWSIRNVDKDPYIPVMPTRPAGATNWATDERATVSVSGTQATFDKTTGSIAWGHQGTGALKFAPPALNNDFVFSFTFRWSGSSWENNNHAFKVGNETVFSVCKAANNSGDTSGYDKVLDYAAHAFVIHVYPNAEDATLSDVDVFMDGVCQKTLIGLNVGANPILTIQQGAQYWGDTTYISDADIYNTNGVDPYIYVKPELPARPAGAINWITSNKTTASLANDNATFDQTEGKYYISLAGGTPVSTINVPEAVWAKDYVLTYTFKMGNSWFDNGLVIKLSDDVTITNMKSPEAGGTNVNGVGAGIVPNDYYNGICQSWGGGVTITAYVHTLADTGKRAVDVYINGSYCGSVYNVDMTNPKLVITNVTQGWGDNINMFNMDLYCVNGDPEFEPEIPTYDVTVEDAVGGTVTGAVTGVEFGTTATLTATPAAGYTFKYWVVNNRTYADAELTLTVTNNIVVVPVFAAEEVTDYTVTFRSKDGRVIAMLSLNALIDGSATAPAVPVRFGYTNGAWEAVNYAELTADADVYPVYEKSTATYTITVKGGSASKTEALFEQRVTVTATEDGFTAWTVDGAVVSTDATYTFLVTGDVVLEAVTTAAQTGVALDLKGTEADNGSFRLSAIGTAYVAEGYTFVEAGIVYSTTTDELEIGADNVKKKASSIMGAGQFMYSLTGAPVNTTIYVSAYVTVKAADGTITTVYSAVENYICNA